MKLTLAGRRLLRTNSDHDGDVYMDMCTGKNDVGEEKESKEGEEEEDE